MEFVLIRHGDPDYSACVRGGINGQGFGLVPLSEKGLQQARQVAAHPALATAGALLPVHPRIADRRGDRAGNRPAFGRGVGSA